MHSTTIDEDDEDTYEVEEIIAHRIGRKQERHFFVKWKGFDSTDNSWVHEANLDSPDLLDAYWRNHALNAELRELEKEKRRSSVRRRMSSKQKSETPSRTLAEVETEEQIENPPEKSNTLSENNEDLVAQSKKKHTKLRTPPPLPGRSKTKQANENNRVPSTSSSRSHTPLDNVTIRQKRNITPAEPSEPMEIEEKLPEIHEETPFENLEDMLDSPIDVESLDVVAEKEKSDEEVDDECGITKGFRISQILQTGTQDGMRYGLVHYKENNVLEWVAFDVIEKYDTGALIKFYETKHRQQHNL